MMERFEMEFNKEYFYCFIFIFQPRKTITSNRQSNILFFLTHDHPWCTCLFFSCNLQTSHFIIFKNAELFRKKNNSRSQKLKCGSYIIHQWKQWKQG